MAAETAKTNPILIAGITPYFLERGGLWFQEHFDDIRKKARREEWWRNHTIFLEPKTRHSFSPFLRTLARMGYVRVGHVEHQGECATHGGIVDVFPINITQPIRIEFSGNTIETISTITLTAEVKPVKLPAPQDATEHERLWLAGLTSGDYLVHRDHGIGVFRNYVDQIDESDKKDKIVRQNEQSDLPVSPGGAMHRAKRLIEYYVLEYAPPRKGGLPDRLLIPRNQAQKLSRYIGFETPVIHRLGSTSWENTKRRAKEDTRKLAEELIEIFRGRAHATRSPYPLHHEIQRHLASSFPFEETPDQIRALREIHDDLSAEKPMDRLLLGDVGFGKTEVAIRAAARVAYSGTQVVLLAPTTILADQHYATFRERLKNLPINVAMLSRLTPKRETRKIVDKLRNGEIDIIIGTHRLISRDVVFRDMGLAIIDEEQRFGVRHKEKFKQLRAEVDILSLSATPIPRTLSLALTKFRDMSFIQTPPRGRLPIQTFVLPFSEKVIAEAISAELKRRGQIFYLWNRIENIEHIRRDLERLSSKARMAVLHGRMREAELIRVMHDFRSGKIDILLATTIIENGLDLPSVNTLIVANAARLGLSQAYQIRGRIGRADTSAYAYFLYPNRGLTEKGKLRLEALRETEGLGAGFHIALKDLEIRGAGNVLGKQQSGTMNKVGLNFYAQLLNEALEELTE